MAFLPELAVQPAAPRDQHLLKPGTSHHPRKDNRLSNEKCRTEHPGYIIIRLMGTPLSLAIAVILAALFSLVVWLFRRIAPQENPESWPIAEGTIQSVRKVAVELGRASYQLDVGDFSYVVNDEYYSGQLQISRSFSTHQAAPENLTDRKIQVRYNPRNPEKYSVPRQETGGFLLDPYSEAGKDIGPIDLNLNKI